MDAKYLVKYSTLHKHIEKKDKKIFNCPLNFVFR